MLSFSLFFLVFIDITGSSLVIVPHSGRRQTFLAHDGKNANDNGKNKNNFEHTNS